MKALFLGTGGAVPRATRPLSGIYVEDWEGHRLLLDASEGVQYRLLENGISPASLDFVAISHAHEDHILGLPGLIATARLMGRQPKVLAPPKLAEELARLGYDVATSAEDRRLRISCVPVCHTVEACGWLLEWDVGYRLDKAKAEGLPRWALTKLIKGEAVEVEGRVIRPEEVADPSSKRFKRLFYTGDTGPCPSAVEPLKWVDVLIHEATFADDVDPAEAHKEGHSTVADAVEAARALGASLLVLTHISARYEDKARHRALAAASGLNAVVPDDYEWLLIQL